MPRNNSRPGENVHRPQARDDAAATAEHDALLIDVLANDRGGNAKTLWSLDQDDKSIQTPAGSKTTLPSGARTWFEDGRLAYDPGTAFDHLALGATEVDTFTYAIRMGNGVVSSATVSVTVTGDNDAPLASADTALTEENAWVFIDVLANDTDVDDGAVLNVISAAAPAGQGHVSIVDNRLLFNPGTDFDRLPQDVQETVTLSYTIRDEHGAESTSTVEVTITGRNDVPEISGDDSGRVSEDDINAVGHLDVLDRDDGEAEMQAVEFGTASDNGYGVFEIFSDGIWLYQLLDNHPAVQALAAGETLTDTVTVTSKDGTANHTITITIEGTDDGPGLTLSAADLLQSTASVDDTVGDQGMDRMFGGQGDDILKLGDGGDRSAFAGGGDDLPIAAMMPVFF